MKKVIGFITVAGVIFSLFGFCRAQKPKSLEAVEFLSGFGWGKLKEKGGYHLTPFIAAFDFDLLGFLNKFNLSPKQLVQFQLEPFVSFVSQPDPNIEAGSAFSLKIGLLPKENKFQPYAKAGVGFLFMSQHTREQSTQFNFIEQAGLGLHYFFSKAVAFTFEGRFRHLSNSSIMRPNNGINTYTILAGVSYYF